MQDISQSSNRGRPVSSKPIAVNRRETQPSDEDRRELLEREYEQELGGVNVSASPLKCAIAEGILEDCFALSRRKGIRLADIRLGDETVATAGSRLPGRGVDPTKFFADTKLGLSLTNDSIALLDRAVKSRVKAILVPFTEESRDAPVVCARDEAREIRESGELFQYIGDTSFGGSPLRCSLAEAVLEDFFALARSRQCSIADVRIADETPHSLGYRLPERHVDPLDFFRETPDGVALTQSSIDYMRRSVEHTARRLRAPFIMEPQN